MDEEEKLLAGKLFCPGDDKLKAIKLRTHNLNQIYNSLREDESEQRESVLHQMLGRLGENGFIQGPVFFHYGCHTFIGDRFFANFNFTVQDDGIVEIGDDCAFGPNVTIVTPQHPLLAAERKGITTAQGYQKGPCYTKPIKIGNACWLGAGVTICPGVTIGDGCVIGAGSVVTKDIPSGMIAAGVPCRVIRPITTADSIAYRAELLE